MSCMTTTKGILRPLTRPKPKANHYQSKTPRQKDLRSQPITNFFKKKKKSTLSVNVGCSKKPQATTIAACSLNKRKRIVLSPTPVDLTLSSDEDEPTPDDITPEEMTSIPCF
ncbi:hypothetical protein SISNIDRAFT_451324 [Sistotremastrum niveocremeum HHB9708]|uniref:Uncharacterized protein n=1 Tax=Sistotremastrum niveocremeum HHB9708 TaxID=1314777 RepID=A0A164X7P0_9AGAM|nr:hypothetical protein SISNIDRAFT_451324 [Sistotremastrum niveocremeum HHB9708]